MGKTAIIRAVTSDARHFQIGSQAGLIVLGILALQFDVEAKLAIMVTGLCVIFQLAFASFFKSGFDPRSALISGLSLVLMLRTHDAGMAAAAAFLVVAGKFLIRIKGKHVFNPSNFALVVLLLSTDKIWVSAGQWGTGAVVVFFTMCLGAMVLYRAGRSDITIAFLLFYGGMVVARSLYLNEPLRIPLHRLESGSLLLFAFFMISDPRATPDARVGRIIFAFLVAAGAYYVQFKLFTPNGLLYSLAFFSLFIPLFDVIFRGPRYQWAQKPDAEKQSDAAAYPQPSSVPSVSSVDSSASYAADDPQISQMITEGSREVRA